ncbi:MAG: DUF1579 family protein [Melioribacteraceae bacterium]|nr:DUF1579 family protein [Melioribacteraceae bacterium]
MKLIYLCILMLTFILSSKAQIQKSCESFNFSQFDFWIGEWDLTWYDSDGNEYKGHNSISKILDDCVIEENFEDYNSGFRGKSVTTYSSLKNNWLQTWVDNTGNFMVFEGGFDNENMILSRNFKNPEGNEIYQRMIFHSIENNSLVWNWEMSKDGGQTWELRWQIFYKRK